MLEPPHILTSPAEHGWGIHRNRIRVTWQHGLMNLRTARVGDVPAVLVVPEEVRGGVALWLTHLGGSAQQTVPMLQRLAAAGRPAVSFDPVLHGGRGDGGDPWELALAVLGSFRTGMWPILGQSTLEAMRIVTWAQQESGTQEDPVVAGGVSMGGDIAIAYAGIDDRVRRVATLGSTPDWQRPGMRDLRDSELVIDQGEPDRYAQWFAEHLDPSRHLEHYLRDVAISFELGEADRHIPAANAERFRRTLIGLDAASADRIKLTVRDGLDHRGITTSQDAETAAIAFLVEQG